MKIILLCLFALITEHAFAQATQQEINEQVWKPFIQSYNSHDTNGFLAVHSKDAVRSPHDAKQVGNWEEYYQQQKKGDDQDKSSGTKRILELRFTERISNKNLAVELGVLEATLTERDSEARAFFGRFPCYLEKRKRHMENIGRHRFI